MHRVYCDVTNHTEVYPVDRFMMSKPDKKQVRYLQSLINIGKRHPEFKGAYPNLKNINTTGDVDIAIRYMKKELNKYELWNVSTRRELQLENGWVPLEENV